jgi:hypothetical protein
MARWRNPSIIPKLSVIGSNLDALEEILLYPQGRLYSLSKFEFGITALPSAQLPTIVGYDIKQGKREL